MHFSRFLTFIFLLTLLLLSTPSSTFADEGKQPDVAPQSPSLTGGPDAYGYTFIDRNSPGGPNSDGLRFTNIAASGTALTVLPTADDGTAVVPIGFPFRFYGVSYTSAFFCANGYLVFGTATCDTVPHNGSGEPTNYIAGWWQDLDGRCAGTEFDYQLVGSSPTRRLIIQWTAVGHYSFQCTGTQLSTFQIVLHETSNIIEVIHDGNAGLGTSALTHYVEIGQTSTSPLTAYAANTVPGANWAVMFLPPPQNTSTALWQCSSPRLAIPDATPAGVNNDIVLPGPSGSDVSDLNVFLQIPHSFVGDLVVTLTHVDTNKTVTLLQSNCSSSHNIGSLFLDDEATGAPVCYTTPAMGTTGTARPTQSLSLFDGDRWQGRWRLNVRDISNADLGTLMTWCMNPTLVPTAVTLNYFEGRPMSDHVELTWETASETELLGFNLYRSTDGVRPDTPLNSELIASQTPGGGQGATYTYQDYSVAPDSTYTYWLEDMALDGTATIHESITVSMMPPTAVALSAWHVAPNLPTNAVLGVAVAGLLLAATYVWNKRRA